MIRKAIIAALCLLAGGMIQAQTVISEWKTEATDGHRTGVVSASATNVSEAMGTVSGRKYYAPNGKVFKGGATPKVAKIMIDAQPEMAMVKEVIGYSTRAMRRQGPECEIYDWIIDEYMRAVKDSTGKEVHVGITNRGGVRADMPAGEILYDDIMSMFPFHNSFCRIELKGSDLRSVFEQMAATSFQIVGGAKIVAKDRKLVSVTIDGEPLDDDKVYGVATLDFLLDGGDGLRLSQKALGVERCNGYVYDTMLDYVRQLTAAGKPIEFENQGWITILGGEARR